MKRRKAPIKKLFDYCERTLYAILFGLPLTIWLLLKDRRTVYFMPHFGMGDYCIALGYLEAFKKANSIDHITLIVPPNRVEVAQFYPYWDSLLILEWPLYAGIISFGGIPIGKTIHRKLKRIINVTYGVLLNPDHFYDNPSVHVDSTTKNVLNLPEDEVRQGPTVPKIHIDGFIEKYNLCFGKTVLLNPYTGGQAVQEVDERFYIELANKLKAKGFMVATILGTEKQKPVKGTQGMVTSLAEAWNLAGWCGYVIGTRSGFFDFIQFSGCNIIAIYEASYRLKEFFTLSFPNNSDEVREYTLEPDQEEELIKNILSDCLAWKVQQTETE